MGLVGLVGRGEDSNIKKRISCLGCQFDIAILFDLSGNSQDKLERYKQLTLNLIEKSELGPHASQFSIVRYSGPGRADTAFHFNKHTNKTRLIKGRHTLPL